ncbi:transglycosylase domain-containing protein [Actinoplanes sp. NPDC051494]|uniref:transglycosylase domain-containing protein n=1 Tax=Actinoplanes sp. NPDC051494 TaxID=3363907 RepID=UPI00378F070B
MPRGVRIVAPRWLPRWLRRTVAVLAVLMTALVAVASGYVASVDLPPDPVPPQASVLYYRDGHTVLARIGLTDRTDVTLDRVPEPVRRAFLAAEDRDFYGHAGISVRGLARALWTNVVHDDGQGASTITQQYARNAYLTQERTAGRKAREAALALKAENRWTKDEILERYLNTIYFGRNADGIEAAARAYFGTGAEHLTVFQGAVLAAIIKDPTRGDPAVDREWAQDRWRWILRAMAEQGWLPADTAEQATYPAVAAESLTANAVSGPTGLIVDRVEDELMRAGVTPQQFRTGGLQVTTTIDADAQTAATESIGKALRGQPGELRAALVAVDPDDGGVRAYYGGDRGRGFFDDALAARPPASTFKPVVLAAAEERGISYQSMYNGSSPRLFGDRGGAPLYNQKNLQCPICPLDTAMVHSLNTPFYALAEQIGPDTVRGVAHRLGVPVRYGRQRTLVDVAGEPSPGRTRSDIALGRYPVAPADMATLYATLAGGGRRTERHFVVSVSTATQAVLHRHDVRSEKVLSPDVAADVGAVLAKVVERDGRVPGVHAAAKTGSQQWADTTDSSDAWTAGWAPGLAAVTWVGRDKPGPIRQKNGRTINGDGMPYGIWRSFLSNALRGRPAPALAPAADVGRREGADLKTLDTTISKGPGVVFPGPQPGELVDRSKATGSWPQRRQQLTRALDDYTATVPDFAVSVVDRRTGRTFDYHGDKPFEAASVIKVELLAALLLRAQDENRTLSGAERSRAERMIRASDNAAATRIYDDLGGPGALRDACHRLGLDDTDPATRFGLSTTTAADQTRMLLALTAAGSPLTRASRELILGLMASVNADQNWGVSAAAFEGERTSLKNGWLSRSTEGGRWIVTSTGRVSGDDTDVAVSVLSRGHPDQQAGIGAVEHIAALTRSYLGW